MNSFSQLAKNNLANSTITPLLFKTLLDRAYVLTVVNQIKFPMEISSLRSSIPHLRASSYLQKFINCELNFNCVLYILGSTQNAKTPIFKGIFTESNGSKMPVIHHLSVESGHFFVSSLLFLAFNAPYFWLKTTKTALIAGAIQATRPAFAR